jgi:DNA-directed RNA polymerase specialized sigma24 family protein
MGIGKAMMDPQHSVTTWIGKLGEGDQEAAQRLWERYFAALVRVAQQRLRGVPKQVADEEDLALSAFHAFCRAVAHKAIPKLRDRDDLWRILVVVTARKAIDQRRRHYSQKRGGGRGATGGTPEGFKDELANLEGVIGHEPDPAFTVQLADELHTLLAVLPDDELRQTARLKLEGYTNEEIAAKMTCGLRSVTRRLALIRRAWENPHDGLAP